MIFSVNTDLVALDNNRKAGSSDTCDRYAADAVLFLTKRRVRGRLYNKYARVRIRTRIREYARNYSAYLPGVVVPCVRTGVVLCVRTGVVGAYVRA